MDARLRFRQGRLPALKQGRIQGSAFPQPMFFLGETAIERFLPGVLIFRVLHDI
jgi:hypothetical protein